jgi:hypothetical protein
MEEYLDENALARLSGRKYAQSEASKKHRKHLGRLEKSQRMWMARGKKFRSTIRIKQMFYKL